MVGTQITPVGSHPTVMVNVRVRVRLLCVLTELKRWMLRTGIRHRARERVEPTFSVSVPAQGCETVGGDEDE